MIRFLGRMQDWLHNGRIMQDKCIDISLYRGRKNKEEGSDNWCCVQSESDTQDTRNQPQVRRIAHESTGKNTRHTRGHHPCHQ